MLARFSLNMLNRAVRLTFVGLFLSWKHFFGSIHIMDEGFDEIGGTGGSSGHCSACWDGESFAGGNFLSIASENRTGSEISYNVSS